MALYAQSKELRRVGVLSRPFRASMHDRPCAADQTISPARPGHRRVATPSLRRRRHSQLPNDWTATMRHSTRLHSQLTRSFRRMQFAALPPGDYSPSLRSPGSQRSPSIWSAATRDPRQASEDAGKWRPGITTIWSKSSPGFFMRKPCPGSRWDFGHPPKPWHSNSESYTQVLRSDFKPATIMEINRLPWSQG
jgi:hypothetical protein